MKRYLPLIFIFTFAISGNTQFKAPIIISSTPTKYFSGLSVGFSNIENKTIINGIKFSNSNPALHLGLLIEKEFSDYFKLSLRPSVLISGDIKNNFNIENKNYSYSYSSALLEVPLLFTFSFNSSKDFNGFPNYVHFGPDLIYNFMNQAVRFTGANNGYASSVIPFVRNYETGLKFGIGYDIKLKFVNFRPEMGYILGFNSLNKNTLPNLNLSEVINNQYTFHIVLSQRMNKVIYKRIERTGPPLWEKLLGIFKRK